MLKALAPILTLGMIGLFASLTRDGLSAKESHWAGRARVATLAVFGFEIVLLALSSIALALAGADSVLRDVAQLLGWGILTCPAFYLVFGSIAALAPRPQDEEGPGLTSSSG